MEVGAGATTKLLCFQAHPGMFRSYLLTVLPQMSQGITVEISNHLSFPLGQIHSEKTVVSQ